MKREDTTVIFGEVAVSPTELAESVLRFCLDELEGSLGSYFVPLEYDANGSSYEPIEELMDLKGRADLVKRVQAHSNCLWRCHIDLGIASAYVYPAVFQNPGGSPATTWLLLVDGIITRFLEENEQIRVPIFVFLCRFAAAVGADSLLAGLAIEEWKPLDKEAVFERAELGTMPLCVAWKKATIEESGIRGKLDEPEDAVLETLDGFRIANFMS